jgi:Xaa-Pro aminopeptidase
VCRDVHRAFVAAARPGVTGAELWQRCLEVVATAGVDDRFMGWGDDRVRFVGHGVGLELDELPVIAPRQTMPLAAGNVIALEPKLFYPGLGAVGLENTYLIRGDGVEKLTLSPEDVMIVPG